MINTLSYLGFGPVRWVHIGSFLGIAAFTVGQAIICLNLMIGFYVLYSCSRRRSRSRSRRRRSPSSRRRRTPPRRRSISRRRDRRYVGHMVSAFQKDLFSTHGLLLSQRQSQIRTVKFKRQTEVLASSIQFALGVPTVTKRSSFARGISIC